MTNRPRNGWVIFWTMTVLFMAGLLACGWAEGHVHPALARDLNGGNLEGKLFGW